MCLCDMFGTQKACVVEQLQWSWSETHLKVILSIRCMSQQMWPKGWEMLRTGEVLDVIQC